MCRGFHNVANWLLVCTQDPNGITLSNTTRSKLKLLTKRNEMRKGLERSQHEAPVAGHRELPANSYQDRDERSRKFRQLEKELSKGSVESRLGKQGSCCQPCARLKFFGLTRL